MPTKALYKDHTAPREARIDDLLARMTLAEKVSQLLHNSPAISRLGIPAYDWWSAAREVAFEITPAMLALVDDNGAARVEPGAFVISVGGTSPGARSVALDAATPVTAHVEITHA